jgi:hypothetical protein
MLQRKLQEVKHQLDTGRAVSVRMWNLTKPRQKLYELSLNSAASVVYWLARRPLVPKIASSLPTEAVGFFGRKKSSACIPSEGK